MDRIEHYDWFNLLDLCIASEEEAYKMIAQGLRFDFIVSITSTLKTRDRLLAFFLPGCENVTALAFYDSTDPTHASGPKSRHIKQLQRVGRLVHAQLNQGIKTSVLVHCFAGRCRSPAAAGIIFETLGMTAKQALAEVQRLRPSCWPNKLMMDLAHAPVRV